MRRRGFVAGFGAATFWPQKAEAQRGGGPRRIGVLMTQPRDDPNMLVAIARFEEVLNKAGIFPGREAIIDWRFGVREPAEARRQTKALITASCEVIVVTGALLAAVVVETTKQVPIVFLHVPDPVGSGFVASLARPTGNATGFTQLEFSLSGKWLQMLKELAPDMTRAGVVRDPVTPSAAPQVAEIERVAPKLGVRIEQVSAREAQEFDEAIARFAVGPPSGLIVTPSGPTVAHRKAIIAAAARNRLPAIYPYRMFATDGGLLSYGPDFTESFAMAAGYVVRILNGEKPAELPVQQPTRFQLVLNLKTARALGRDVPDALLVRADEVIE